MDRTGEERFSGADKRRQARQRLLEAGAEYRAASADLQKRRAERDVAIVEATSYGLSRREVAEVAGVTVGRVQQILDRI